MNGVRHSTRKLAWGEPGRVFLPLCLLPVLFISCSRCSGALPGEGRFRSGEPVEITFMCWNVQNLFDDADNGTEYDDFDPENGEWTVDMFHAKLLSVAEVIEAAVPRGPDIIALQEIENLNTLLTLKDEVLKGLDYSYHALVETPGSAVNTAVLSKHPIAEVRAHSVHTETGEGPRHVLEVEIDVHGSVLFVLNNHWKSKLGGAEETERARRDYAELVVQRIRRIGSKTPEALIIVCGDLNENHDEFLLIDEAYVTALMPFEKAAAPDDDGSGGSGRGSDTAGGVLWITGEAGNCTLGPGRTVLYSPWFEGGYPGSYFYRNRWETIDHVLLSGGFFNGFGIEYDGFKVFADPFMVDEQGTPLKWLNKTVSGYSDHLPLLVTLRL